VETKLAEYSLPTIDDSYKEDLKKSREYIQRLREMTSQIPINIEELNGLLNEAIDFIYRFYNNINNIIGMSIMVENAIVFGNKYRSIYPEIDRELSKAEFQYLNGEYTKALKTAITCMETLFPENADERIMENT
ncbi:MAG: selenide, water dikinase, partial [Erysipelotrichaceae bacterium]|nr:selenide, water dikinase [Erysipelotrichaceae bacterium]